jgi:hypothetical protein
MLAPTSNVGAASDQKKIGIRGLLLDFGVYVTHQIQNRPRAYDGMNVSLTSI